MPRLLPPSMSKPWYRAWPGALAGVFIGLAPGPATGGVAAGSSPGVDTPVFAIQGRGAASALAGERVATHGAVTRVDSDGFFLQDVVGDGDPLTSDALFVFTGAPPAVRAGQCVHVEGRVVEFDARHPEAAGAAASAGADAVTELHEASVPRVLGDHCEVLPVELSLPLAEGEDLRRLEGMLVTLHGPLTVQQNYFLGRFGQLTLAVGGRLEVPTQRWPPGAQARALAAGEARRTIVLDDGDAHQFPPVAPWLGDDGTVRAGDTVASVTGVIDRGPVTASAAGPLAWQIHPTGAVRFSRANPRTPAPAPVRGTLKVASANVDNFFTSLADGRHACAPGHRPGDCRGARDLPEFRRQRAKLVAELAAMDADIVGLMEIENNGAVALRSLVDALNARLGAAVYARVARPAKGGDDAIQVALIYKPARVRPVGAALADPDPVHNRSPLAQTFAVIRPAPGRAANGVRPARDSSVGAGETRFNVVVVHFKSRRCDGAQGLDADQGDLQGCWNHRRVLQGRALLAFVASVQRHGGVADTLLVGDFNAYPREEPIAELVRGGFADEVERFDPGGYSYVFDGAAGRLDQALASESLASRVTGATEWHVNADEPALLAYPFVGPPPGCRACRPNPDAATPWRASDHDPLVIGLAPGP